MATKRSTRIRNGVPKAEEAHEKTAVVTAASKNQSGSTGSQSEKVSGSLRRSNRTKTVTSGDATGEEETETPTSRSSNGKESSSKSSSVSKESSSKAGSTVAATDGKSQRNDLMPDEIMAIFSNRGAGKRQPKIMTSVVLPSMIRMGGDAEDDDEDFHVQEEELEVESDSSGAEDNEDQQNDQDSDDDSDGSDSDGSDNEQEPRSKRRKVARASLNHDADQDSSGDDSGGNKNDSDEDQSSDDDLTLVQTLDKFGQQSEQDKNRANHLICAVCLLTEGELDDYIVQCDRCGVSVHEGCYGDPSSGLDTDTQSESSDGSETEPWFCAVCLAGLSSPPDCELCPSVGGIYRQTDDNNWIHVICGLYIHPVSYGELERLENACLQLVPSQFWGAKICAFCDDTRFARSGIALQCDAGLCKTYYHASCGQKMGFLAEAELREGGKTGDLAAESPSLSFNFFSYCKLHSDPDTVKQRQRTYNLLQKQVSSFESTMTGKVERCFEKESVKYLESRKLVEAWYPDTPVPRLMSTRPALAKQLTKKAEVLGKLCDGVPTEFTVNITNKWHIQPAFNVNFVAYFQDRERRFKELQSSIVKNVRCNKQLKEDLALLEKKLRKITYIVDNMQKVIDKRVNQMIDATSHLRGLTNLEYSLPITCTATLDLISKQPTAKKSSAVKPKEETEDGGPHSKEASAGAVSEKSADKTKDEDNLFIVLNKCEICKLRNNQHLLIQCDSCKQHFHINCLDPPLSRVPKKGEKWLWQCRLCCPDTTKVEVFEDNLPRRRKKTVVYGREESDKEKDKEKENQDKDKEKDTTEKDKSKDKEAPKRETFPEVELKPTGSDVKVEKKAPVEPEKSVPDLTLGLAMPERRKSDEVVVKKPPQIVTRKPPPFAPTKQALRVFEFECSDTEADVPTKRVEEAKSASPGSETTQIDKKPSPSFEEKKTVSHSSEEIDSGISVPKKSGETVRHEKVDDTTKYETQRKSQVPLTKEVPVRNEELAASQTKRLSQPYLKASEAEDTTTVLPKPVSEKVSLEAVQTNVEASVDRGLSTKDEQITPHDKICGETAELGTKMKDSEESRFQQITKNVLQDVSPAPSEEFAKRTEPDSRQENAESSSVSSSSTDNTFETVEQHASSDFVVNEVTREESADTNVVISLPHATQQPQSQTQDLQPATDEQRGSVTTSAEKDYHGSHSSSSSSSSDSESIKADSIVYEEPGVKTRSNSSDDTIGFGGSDKKRKVGDQSASKYDKVSKEEQIVQQEQGESQQFVDTGPELSLPPVEEESSQANLSKLPKSSPQEFIAKWATKLRVNFSCDASEQQSSSSTEKDLTPEDEVRSVAILADSREALNEKPEQLVEEDKSLKTQNEKLEVLQPSEKKAKEPEKSVPASDKNSENVEEVVQYREITKISPEGEAIVVRVPIRKKPAPVPQPEPKVSEISADKFKDLLIRLETVGDTTARPPQSKEIKSVAAEKEMKSTSQVLSKVNKPHERPVDEQRDGKISATIGSRDPLELFVPIKKPEKPTASLLLKDKVEEVEKKKKRKLEQISTGPAKVPAFSNEKTQDAPPKQVEDSSKIRKVSIVAPDFDNDESHNMKADLIQNVVPAVMDKLTAKVPEVKQPAFDEKRGRVQNEANQQRRTSDSSSQPETLAKDKKLTLPLEEPSRGSKESKDVESSQSGKRVNENEVEKKFKAIDKVPKVPDNEKSAKPDSSTTNGSQGLTSKQSKMSKVQLIDDLFGDIGGGGLGASSTGASKSVKSSKKSVPQSKSESEKKVGPEYEKTFKKVESSSYMPRSKIPPLEVESNELAKKTEQKAEVAQKDAKPKGAVDVSEENLSTKRPSVQHFKIPKTKKPAQKEVPLSKQELIKEYGGARSEDPKPKESVSAAKPKESGNRRIFGTNEPKKPVHQFPPAREFMKVKNPQDFPPAKVGPPLPPTSDFRHKSPTFTSPVKITPLVGGEKFKEKLGQLMELGGALVDDIGPISKIDDDDEYDPTSNYKVDVANKKRQSSNSGNAVPITSLPANLPPPPTGFNYEDFDYDKPPSPPPGLLAFDKAPKPKVAKSTIIPGKDPPHSKPSSTGGIPPPIVMIPPGRASREGVRRAPSHEPPEHDHERKRMHPKSPSDMYHIPSQSTQPKRKKDLQQYRQENRTKVGHTPAGYASTSAVNFAESSHRRLQSSPGPVNDEVFQVEDAGGNFDERTERKSSEETSRPGTPVLDESTDPLIIRSTDPNDPVVNPSDVPLSPNATVRIMQMLIDSDMFANQ